MLFKFSAAVALTLVVAFGSPALAGEVRIDMRDGRVTLDARDASLQEILAEWTKVGGARILNGEKLLGDRVTLQLADVPEMRALEIVLRSAAGFVAAPRAASNPGVSKYDRVMIMATSTPPATAARMPGPDGFAQPMQPDNNTPEQLPPGTIRLPTYPGGYPAGLNTQPSYTTQPGMMPYQPSGVTPYQPAGAAGGMMITPQPGGGVSITPANPQTPTGVFPGTSPVPGTIIAPAVPGAPSVPPKPPGIPR